MQGSGILPLFLAGSAIFLLMGLALVLFVMQYQRRMVQQAEDLKEKEAQHQKKMLQATIESQEKERYRIASNLHDGLGAHLSTIRLNMLMYSEEHEGTKEFAENMAEMLSESIQQVREISHDLLPGALKTYGLISAWKEFFRKVDEGSHLTITLQDEGVPQRLPDAHELALYRVTQELVNNTLKHANASTISLTAKWLETGLQLIYADNGVGFKSEQLSYGLGMYTMQSRLQALQGSLEVETSPGKGFNCTIYIPIQASHTKPHE